MSESLLEAALKVTVKKLKHRDNAELELALAWFRGRVTNAQVAATLGIRDSNVSARFANLLRGFVSSGAVVLDRNGKKP